jgi:hypothetical protein
MDERRCVECQKSAVRLRRDRCDACYMRLYRGGDVPSGASCGGCGERRRELLCVETVGSGDAVVCGNCALVLRRARPRLTSLAELARRRGRERRAPSPGAMPAAFSAVGRRAEDQRPQPARAGSSFDLEID